MTKAEIVLREALVSIAAKWQEMDDYDHSDFDYRLLARKMETIARVAIARPPALPDGWDICDHCGRHIFRHYDWSHEGGTPPQDHDAVPRRSTPSAG